LTARAEGALGHFLHDVVAADGFNNFFLGLVAVIFIVGMLIAVAGGMFAVRRNGVCFTGVFGGLIVAMFGVRRIVGMGGVFAGVLLVEVLIMPVFFVRFRARRRHRGRGLDGHRNRHVGRRFNGRRLARVSMVVPPRSVFISVFMLMLMIVRVVMIMLVRMLMVVMIVMFMIMMLGIGVEMAGIGGVAVFGVRAVRIVKWLSRLRRIGAGVLDDLALNAFATATAALIAVTRTAVAAGAIFGFFFGLAMGAFVRLDQRLAIGDRNLIIVRMDFAEGEKAVTVATILDEGSLQGWFYARDFGKVDIAAQLFALSGLEIKLFDSIAADDDDPGFFRVGGIDQHFVGHFGTLDGGGRVWRCARIARPGDATVHLIRG
jgi:MFS family permease